MKGVITALCLLSFAGLIRSHSTNPTVKVLNGTYTGIRNRIYNQDLFLGIPFAQQPVGNLRFSRPQSLNESWKGTRDATSYSPICVGYGSDSIWYPTSEACLTLNVVRDSSAHRHSNLPVGVWLYGGGFVEGSSADQRYNLSFIVNHSHKIGKPFIGVSINYRLAAWGFLSSNEVAGTGNTNLGLRDQRLALHWIKENIQAFGGDPNKVTIWGVSSGGTSAGYHLTAFGGRDDGLFRGAILESGGSIATGAMNTTAYQSQYNTLVSRVNCTQEVDTLQCLREVPFDTLNSVLNSSVSTQPFNFAPLVDGDILRSWGSRQLAEKQFVKVPILCGTNTDEGSIFAPVGINTTGEFHDYLTSGQAGYKLPDSAADRILDLYPDDPSQGIPAFLGDARVSSMGNQWRRVSAYVGDSLMHANRRKQCEAWANSSTPAYCYRFNVHSNDISLIYGATHFEEVAFVFNNIYGVGYHYGKPFSNTPNSYKELSSLMASMWASFIHDLNPNTGVFGFEIKWNPYSTDYPVNMVFDANITSHLEPDTWRADAISYINTIAPVYYH
ncbi:hypothetical protein V495_01758 [Pseudogymnoascus sp. VKM F-4514 (FW-929)]|nr:hypothetical protein V495_01758 [Pseudogymnoascus sp. VKM F-4514 (FW-929)]KFY59250.1 hypothetical protein V497_04403 [Pseudogymnoascus sp. VKM F-4516 (FW-969)]